MRVFVALLLMTATLDAAPVSGHVRFVGRAAGFITPAVVYAESLDAGRIQAGQFSMTQKNKTFLPHVLVVPVGSSVAFPNEDPIFHNVFSLSRPGPFDLGLYRDGASKTKMFTAPSTYHVFCNIHPQMSAFILVVPTSFITEADSAGNYRLDLPAGRYRITAWSERAEISSVDLTVGAGAVTAAELTLDESHFVETQHKNKFGQDYAKKN
jgi:plastocyanin